MFISVLFLTSTQGNILWKVSDRIDAKLPVTLLEQP